MSRQTIKLRKDERQVHAPMDLANGALTALSAIPGVLDPELVGAEGETVVLTYEWKGSGTYWETDETLIKYGFSRIWE